MNIKQNGEFCMMTKQLNQFIPENKALSILDVFINESPDCVLITDADGILILVNRSYEKLAGVKAEDILGRNISVLVTNGIVDRVIWPMVFQKKKTITALQKLLQTGKQVLVTINPVFSDEGEIVYLVGTSRDMEELNKLKTELEETRKENQRYKEIVTDIFDRELIESKIIAESKAMKQIIETTIRIAKYDIPILITGESGTGKEVLTRFIHSISSRNSKPFITINCSTLPEHLVESELFGYLPGAFTGADKQGKQGLFEIADNGTLFLDEIGELPLSIQAKLLRVLEDMTVRRLGSTTSKQVDVRIIAATNRDLENEVKLGRFREDLFFRLSVMPLYIPPLRERKEDILPLIRRNLKFFNEKYNTNKKLDSYTLKYLENYDWPGNARELRNLVERLVVCIEGALISSSDLPQQFGVASGTYPVQVEKENSACLKSSVAAIEKELVMEAWKEYGSSRKAAAALGISQSTFQRKLHSYILDPSQNH